MCDIREHNRRRFAATFLIMSYKYHHNRRMQARGATVQERNKKTLSNHLALQAGLHHRTMYRRSLAIFGNALPNFLGQVRVLEKFRDYTQLIKDVQRRARENAERIRLQKYTMETELFTLIVQKLEKFMYAAKAKDLHAKLQNVNK